VDRAAALVEAVASQGGPRLAAVEWHDELGSTSDRLKELARAGAPEWTAVLAERQTSGRGRGERAWLSPPGGLYLSVLLRPAAAKAAVLPLAAGVAVAEAASRLGVAAELKWPNDVLVKGRKLAGILAEAASSGATLDWVALGIGVNVGLDPKLLPAELQGAVTSLAAEGRAAAPDAVAALVLARLAVCYDQLRESPARAVAAWRARAAPWWGSAVSVTSGASVLHGRLRAVDDDGALVLELPDGELRRLVSGEVSQLRRGAP